jgi:hypothetical protein
MTKQEIRDAMVAYLDSLPDDADVRIDMISRKVEGYSPDPGFVCYEPDGTQRVTIRVSLPLDVARRGGVAR